MPDKDLAVFITALDDLIEQPIDVQERKLTAVSDAYQAAGLQDVAESFDAILQLPPTSRISALRQLRDKLTGRRRD